MTDDGLTTDALELQLHHGSNRAFIGQLNIKGEGLTCMRKGDGLTCM